MSSRTPLVLTLAAAIALVAPLATAGTGDTIREGVRNPSGGAASRETQIIARTGKDSYGTRQSNLGQGGGAIYGCRSTLDVSGVGDPARSTACVRINNLRDGKAFDLQSSSGRIIGLIQSGPSITVPKPAVAPFVTNATAVATGLNADRVDGLNASEIVAQAAGAGGGGCPASTTLAGGGCIENEPRSAATFAAAAAACGEAGRRMVAPDVLLHARTLGAINLGSGELSADITPDSVALLTNAIVQGVATVSDAGAIGVVAQSASTPYRCITR